MTYYAFYDPNKDDDPLVGFLLLGLLLVVAVGLVVATW